MSSKAATARQPMGELRSARLVDLSSDPLIQRLNSYGNKVEIKTIREGGLADCYVSFEVVDNAEVPVKEKWAKELAEQFGQIAETDGGTGQHTPIKLGSIEGEPLFKIMDGFHRSAALHSRGEDRIYATVKLTDWDGLYDDRIFNAKDHRQIRFSRVVQWIQEVWTYSGLSDRMTVEQAVLLYRFNTSGAKLGLKPKEVEAAKAWVERKQRQWGMAAMTIHRDLKIAQHVDPVIVFSTREKPDPDVLEAPTQSIIRVLADQIPDRFDLQALVVDAAKDHNLEAPEVNALCTRVKGSKTLSDAKRIISKVDWDNVQPEYAETTKRALRRAYDPRHKGAMVLRSAHQSVVTVLDRINLSFNRGEEITPEMMHNIVEAGRSIDTMIEDLGGLSAKLGELLATNYFRHRNSLEDNLQAYLDGITEKMPVIKTDEDIAVAKALLETGSFEGDPILKVDIQEEIAARERLNQRKQK